MKRKTLSILIVVTTICCFGTIGTAFAYVGPGAGLSLLGALWGLLLAVGAALLFVILWPVRRMMRKGRAKKTGDGGDDEIGLDEKTESLNR